jgi:nucleotide-binding universal stress UspA family protein
LQRGFKPIQPEWLSTVIKGAIMFPAHTILYPTDFSDCSRAAFSLARSLALEHGSKLIVLHVDQTWGRSIAYGEAMVLLQPVELKERMWEGLRCFNIDNPSVQVEHRLVEGEAAGQILRVAEENDCDLIVMGTHGRTGLARLVLGSVAEQVLRKARCPVLTVKMPRAAIAKRRLGEEDHNPSEATCANPHTA